MILTNTGARGWYVGSVQKLQSIYGCKGAGPKAVKAHKTRKPTQEKYKQAGTADLGGRLGLIPNKTGCAKMCGNDLLPGLKLRIYWLAVGVVNEGLIIEKDVEFVVAIGVDVFRLILKVATPFRS